MDSQRILGIVLAGAAGKRLADLFVAEATNYPAFHSRLIQARKEWGLNSGS